MSFKLRLFDNNILKTLSFNVKVNKGRTSEYSQYINSEFSRMRLTRDVDGNHYFRDASNIALVGPYVFDIDTRSRRR